MSAINSLFVCLIPTLRVYSRLSVHTPQTPVPYSASSITWCGARSTVVQILVAPVDGRLKALLRQKSEELGITLHTLEIRPDHVHLFVEADPTRCVAEIVNRLKGFTSHVLRAEFAALRSRLPTLWSRSYYAGTVGSVREAVVRKYIEAQKRK